MTDQSPRAAPRTVIVGLGNPVLGDDGVGWRVADEVERRLGADGPKPEGVEVERLGVGGLRLMEFLSGYDRAILVDAAEFPDRPIGEIRTQRLDELAGPGPGHLDSAHDASLATALELGRGLGAELPGSIDVVTVQVARTDIFSEELSPEIAALVPAATDAVLGLLARQS